MVACLDREDGNHARLLPLYIEQILSYLREHGGRLDGVVLSEGPGSYTGLRIAASTAKGLCYGLDVPLYVVSTPMVLCAAYAATAPVDAECLCPMIDARRMEVYTALYDTNLQALLPVRAEVIDGEWLADVLQTQRVAFFGDGAMKCSTVLTSPNAMFVDGVVPDARYMGTLAENGLCRRIEGKEIAYYDPFYLKDFVAAPSHVKGLGRPDKNK